MGVHPDVVILGGGVIGLTVAYYLARDGCRITVLDRGEMGREASWAGAGIIPPGNPSQATHPSDWLRAASAAVFPTLSAQLAELTGVDNGFRRCGGVELVGGADAATVSAWRREGIDFQFGSPAELASIEREFRLLPEAGYFLPGMAQVRNPWHLKALTAACRIVGVNLQPNTTVVGFASKGGRIVAARSTDSDWCADRFLVATGAWADELLAPLGLQLGVHPIRGQIVLYRLPEPPFRPIVLQGLRYLVPRTDGRILAGSTEEQAGFDRSTTREGIADLRRFAESVAPCLSNAEIETAWGGLRPATRDGLPFLGKAPGFENLFVAAGHFRAGIQLSPATGQVMKDLLLGQSPAVSLAPFSLDRYAGVDL